MTMTGLDAATRRIVGVLQERRSLSRLLALALAVLGRSRCCGQWWLRS